MGIDFPTIQTNFWDAIIAVPVVMVLTQILKLIFKFNKRYVPLLALILGLSFSIFISHRHNFIGGIFMGWFYGYAAIGTYASLKTSIRSFRRENNDS